MPGFAQQVLAIVFPGKACRQHEQQADRQRPAAGRQLQDGPAVAHQEAEQSHDRHCRLCFLDHTRGGVGFCLPCLPGIGLWLRGQKEPIAVGGVPGRVIFLSACHPPGYSGLVGLSPSVISWPLLPCLGERSRSLGATTWRGRGWFRQHDLDAPGAEDRDERCGLARGKKFHVVAQGAMCFGPGFLSPLVNSWHSPRHTEPFSC